MIVRRQIVPGINAHGKNTVAFLRGGKDLRRSLPWRQGQRPRVHDLLVKEQIEHRLLGVGGEIDNAGVNGAFLVIFRVVADIQRGNSQIIASHTFAVVGHAQPFVLEFAQIARRAVAEEVDFRVMFVAHQRAGQFERLSQTGCGIGHLAVFNRPAEHGFVRGGGLLDDGVAGGQEDEHLFLVLKTVHQVKGLGAGLLEAGRRFISALHRG